MSRTPSPSSEGHRLSEAVARWLTGPEAVAPLADHADAEATPAAVARLRRTLTVEHAAAVLDQAALRRRASAKFGRAERMFFTRVGLEQATDEWIARYKAGRIAPVVGDGRVAEVCSGVGGDLAGLAARGVDALGIERDPAVAILSASNAAVYADGADGPTVAAREATDRDLADVAAWHADPDRRASGRRTTRPDAHDPPLDRLAAWRAGCPASAIKFAPAARLPEDWQAECELQWISRGGECRQLVAWGGALADRRGERVATRVEADGRPAASLAGDARVAPPMTDRVAALVFEPDPAVIAGRLVGAAAERWGVAAWAAGVAYLTGDRPIDHPLVAAFAVEETMPLDRRRLADWLAARGVGRLEIKTRGVGVDPERLRRELRPRGEAQATLLVAPDPVAGGAKPVVIAARRV